MTDEPTNNVVRFTGLTKLDLEPDAILTAALGSLTEVVIIGTTKDGNQYFATSSADGKNILWLLETARFMLMDNIFSGDYDDE
jgi:hypothetical protein